MNPHPPSPLSKRRRCNEPGKTSTDDQSVMLTARIHDGYSQRIDVIM
jgi:hypothetical protein